MISNKNFSSKISAHNAGKCNLKIKAKIKFVYSEKVTKFCKISTSLLSTVPTDKSKVEVLQNFVTFSEYMDFKDHYLCVWHQFEEFNG